MIKFTHQSVYVIIKELFFFKQERKQELEQILCLNLSNTAQCHHEQHEYNNNNNKRKKKEKKKEKAMDREY